MSSHENDYPVTVESDGIKLKTEKMMPDELYHCIYENKVFLFFKDDQGMLNCYEVDDPAAAREIANDPSQVEFILKKYAEQDL
jgi:hypothetical protein